MPLKSINPATEEELSQIEEISAEEVAAKIGESQTAFQSWKKASFAERGECFKKAAELLRSNAREFGEIMTLEMGKPIKSAIAEAEKCAWVCEYYAENAEEILKKELVETDASESYVQFDPLGIVLAVMPWNYPFWQLLRAAAPIMMAGNTILLKHASNVPQCAAKIEELFQHAGFPEGSMINLAISSVKVAAIIADDRVKAATLTGSEYAGSQVAAQCGKEIKRSLLELGGSDPFIILADADLDAAATTAAKARFQNNGQSCIAAKRFIVIESVYNEFLEKFKAAAEALKVGDPMKEETEIGPLATKSILEELEEQVNQSVEKGATIIAGGSRPTSPTTPNTTAPGYFYQPTILSNITKGMPAYDEETFGPVAAVIKASDEEEAIQIANDSRLGLGSSLWTKDTQKAKKLATRINSGAVFINGMTKSDPRLPFGGINKSGYGRELSHYGMKEFVNAKTVWIA